MILPIGVQPNWWLSEPTAPERFKSLSGVDSETEIVEELSPAPAGIVTDSKDTAGNCLWRPASIGWNSHSRPFNEGLILYNGHAGLGEATAVRVPHRPEAPT